MKPDTRRMHPTLLLPRYLEWEFRMKEGLAIPFVLTCVERTSAEQEALHAQGRMDLPSVNRLRAAAGMSAIGESDNAYCVTWTLNSKHIKRGDGWVYAFDFALLVPGKRIITWDSKWDADHDGVPEYIEAARLAKECGLESGAFWKKPDIPHVQVKVA